MSSSCLTTSEISDLFVEEIESQSGRITDTFDDGLRLFQRSVFPRFEDVQPQDRLQGGVALKATLDEICVFPYVLREVCSNGAVMAHSLYSYRLERSIDETTEELSSTISEAITACSQEKSFTNSVKQIRSTLHDEINLALTLLPMISSFPGGPSGDIARLILEQVFAEGLPSMFGLMNAITSVARDTEDPEDRWRLEELGGGIAAGIFPKPPVNAPGVAKGFSRPVTLK
ncbi:hypothetical protein Pan258_51200 [Symmachiella dynata]|uniref:hypothetical protein n=1 Tax=Symmachiella dynata TaxID=2527995 RepID=UPI00118A6A33|nr:hypothetical protein [Symmachiella dynata]QDT51037.1 hypothetical protein Pan258_51200 [Symmachiella dynata]